jgi:hypothetical protein
VDLLNELEKIEWQQLGHFYGNARDVPLLFRNLVEADLENWDQCLYELVNTVAHQGDVISSTPAIMPYMVRYIDHCPPEKLDQLLLTFIIMGENLESWIRNGIRPHKAGEVVDTFRSIGNGYRTYLRLLKHDDPAIRYLTVRLCGLFVQHHHRTRNQLRHAFQMETDPMVMWQLLMSMSNLISKLWFKGQLKIERVHRHLFETTVSEHADERVRLAAASAWLKLDRSPGEHAPDAVVRLIVKAVSGHIPLDWDYFYPPEYYEPLLDLRQLTVHELAAALTMPEILPKTAHLIIREMLDKVLPRIRGNDPKFSSRFTTDTWSIYRQNTSSDHSLMYDIPTRNLMGNVQEHLAKKNDTLIAVLQSIIDSDAFWQVPTNLLSFFYALPDNREELNDHIASIKTQMEDGQKE